MTAKLSISVSDADLAIIDAVAHANGGNRSAVIHDMVRVFRELQAEDGYVRMFAEWDDSDDKRLWDATTSDGLR